MGLAAVLCAGCLASAASAKKIEPKKIEHNPRGKLLGAVPRAGSAAARSQLRAAQSSPSLAGLSYHGGPVMHSSKTYAIFWQPSGYSPSFSAPYKTLVGGYLADVAAASFQRSNVYSSDIQYYDTGGHIAYDSTYGGVIDATDAFPTQLCVDTARPTNPCVTDADVQGELDKVFKAHPGLPHGLDAIYLVFIPPGVSSCFAAGSSRDCSFTKEGYCAYHSNTADSLYTVQVYPDTGGCDAAKQYPNYANSDSTTKDADVQIGLASHEYNETITDPLGNAWFEDAPFTPEDGMENGDKCFVDFGAALGSTGTGAYNQLINGHPYWTQTEWSNLENSCVLRSLNATPRPSLAASPNPAAPRQAVSFDASQSSDPDGSVTATGWNFGDGATASGPTATHAYAAPGSYTATVTVTDNEGASASVSRTITVPAPPPPPPPPPTIGFLANQRSITATRKGYFSYSLKGTPPGAGGRISFATSSAIAARVRKRKLGFGSFTFRLSSSGRATVTIKISRTNLAILKRKHSLSLRATVVIGRVTRSIVFTLKAPR